MKNKMLKPEIEFIRFNTQDIITTSGESKLKNFKGTPVVDDTDKSLNQNYGGWTGFKNSAGEIQ